MQPISSVEPEISSVSSTSLKFYGTSFPKPLRGFVRQENSPLNYNSSLNGFHRFLQ